MTHEVSYIIPCQEVSDQDRSNFRKAMRQLAKKRVEERDDLDAGAEEINRQQYNMKIKCPEELSDATVIVFGRDGKTYIFTPKGKKTKLYNSPDVFLCKLNNNEINVDSFCTVNHIAYSEDGSDDPWVNVGGTMVQVP